MRLSIPKRMVGIASAVCAPRLEYVPIPDWRSVAAAEPGG